MDSKTIIVRRKISTPSHLDNLHPILQRVYAARGIFKEQDIERGLEHLFPFQSLLGIEQASISLANAIINQQKILIVGDFDADGATSTALAVSALRILGAGDVQYLVPNRFEYGYGLTPEIVEVAAKFNPRMIVTVDNGISSCAGVDYANQLGIEVIITDHHLAGAQLPNAVAIVNPNQPGCLFESKNLAGVGVIFYVMLALRAHLRKIEWFQQSGILDPNMSQFLDLVALGSVADVVPLDKNNRILIHQGLNRIRAGKCRPGIRALLEIAKRQPEKISAADLGFAVGPRLNAAGRLDDMSLGIECLLCEDLASARKFAKTLDTLNEERRQIESQMQNQALKTLSQLPLQQELLPTGVCLFDETWHQGVIGILASRMKDRLHRPVIAFAPFNEQELKGSARSIAGIHIRDVLDAIATRYPSLINKFGGHAMAAGLTLLRKNYQDFASAFDTEIKSQVDPSTLRNEIYSDGELTKEDLNLRLAELLREAGPWGQHFPEPIFDGKFKIIQQRLVGGKHLKLILSSEEKQLDAIMFNINHDHWPNHRAENVWAAYKLDVNEYNGIKSVQLNIEHLEVV